MHSIDLIVFKARLLKILDLWWQRQLWKGGFVTFNAGDFLICMLEHWFSQLQRGNINLCVSVSWFLIMDFWNRHIGEPQERHEENNGYIVNERPVRRRMQ